MTKTVLVTPAQVDAAKAVVAWSDAAGQPVSEAVLRIANARTPEELAPESQHQTPAPSNRRLAPNVGAGMRAFAGSARSSSYRPSVFPDFLGRRTGGRLTTASRSERAQFEPELIATLADLLSARINLSSPLVISTLATRMPVSVAVPAPEQGATLDDLRTWLDRVVRVAKEDGIETREVYKAAKEAVEAVDALINDYEAEREEPQSHIATEQPVHERPVQEEAAQQESDFVTDQAAAAEAAADESAYDEPLTTEDSDRYWRR